MRRLVGLVVLLLLAGCANPFEQAFRETGAGLKSDRVVYNAEPIRALRGSDISPPGQVSDVRALFTEGYQPIGVAGFVGSRPDVEAAVAQGRKVGASVVVFYSRYQGTLTGTTLVSTPMTITHVGHRGHVYTTTVYTTQQVPYAIDRFDLVAGYFARSKDYGVGLMLAPPSPEEQKAFGTDKGQVVRAVRRDSTAWQADIVPGDLVLKIDGQTVDGAPEDGSLFAPLAGRDVTLTVRRLPERPGGKPTELTRTIFVRPVS